MNNSASNKMPFLFWNVSKKKFVAFYGIFSYGFCDTDWMCDSRLPSTDEVYKAALDICSDEDTAEFDSENEAISWLKNKIFQEVMLARKNTI